MAEHLDLRLLLLLSFLIPSVVAQTDTADPTTSPTPSPTTLVPTTAPTLATGTWETDCTTTESGDITYSESSGSFTLDANATISIQTDDTDSTSECTLELTLPAYSEMDFEDDAICDLDITLSAVGETSANISLMDVNLYHIFTVSDSTMVWMNDLNADGTLHRLYSGPSCDASSFLESPDFITDYASDLTYDVSTINGHFNGSSSTQNVNGWVGLLPFSFSVSNDLSGNSGTILTTTQSTLDSVNCSYNDTFDAAKEITYTLFATTWMEDTTAPTSHPTREPTSGPTDDPTNPPTADPTPLPTEDTSAPTVDPTPSPSTFAPTAETGAPTIGTPTAETQSPSIGTPTEEPTTAKPSVQPTADPTNSPTPFPTEPTTDPTPSPSGYPTASPTPFPTTGATSLSLTVSITRVCVTDSPTTSPTLPTKEPTSGPTSVPTSEPTSVPTKPTMEPTFEPTAFDMTEMTIVTDIEEETTEEGEFELSTEEKIGAVVVLGVLMCCGGLFVVVLIYRKSSYLGKETDDLLNLQAKIGGPTEFIEMSEKASAGTKFTVTEDAHNEMLKEIEGSLSIGLET